MKVRKVFNSKTSDLSFCVLGKRHTMVLVNLAIVIIYYTNSKGMTAFVPH